MLEEGAHASPQEMLPFPSLPLWMLFLLPSPQPHPTSLQEPKICCALPEAEHGPASPWHGGEAEGSPGTWEGFLRLSVPKRVLQTPARRELPTCSGC